MTLPRNLLLLVSVFPFLLPGPARADAPVKVRLLRVQQVGATTYFHVRFDAPADLLDAAIRPGPYAEAERRALALTPMLVPQDGKTSAVYQRLDLEHFRPNVQFRDRAEIPPIDGLEFAGKLDGAGKAKFVLLYPTTTKEKAPPGIQDKELAKLLRPTRWREVPIEMDFAKSDALPAKANLEKLWAHAQASRFAVLEAQAPQTGFFGFACAATGRKYGVPDPALEGERLTADEHVHRKMFDLTTGALAITESLALKRLRTTGVRAAVERSVDIKTVRGIEIAEHPWKKMMGVNKPAAEPLAELVPHDNYYLRFKTFAKFNEFSVLMDKWGTPASRAYESQSRDHALKERYERQLCLKSTYLGRTLGPLLIKSIAITGSDPYIREGTDVTVLFHVNNRSLFLTGVEQFIDEARKEHGARLKESKQVYNSIPIESFVTPLREVSVHRAGFGDFVVYSNSPVGLRRVIDTHQRKHKSLASSLDFQYMRTVFRADDKEEDGFAFLSDAFIRQLVGPASKIKEMRRLEAMTSMSMVNNAALFAAWETGKLPGDHDALLKAAHLKQEHLFVPEGKPIRWDATQKTAVSDVYNTLHFTTPLIETPIDKITWYEDQTYREFRVGYEQLWRQFFDPVGIRFNLGKEQIKLEVYVLPMVNNAEYNKLRQWTGRDVMQFDPSKLSPRSLLQFTTSIGGDFKWGLIRLDDNKTLARLGEWWIRNDLLSKERTEYDTEAARLILQLPITAGIGDRGNWIRGLVIATLKDTDRFGPAKFTDSTYNATVITKMTLGPDSKIVKNLNEKLEKGKLQQVVVYYATIDDGWYIGFDKQALKDLIDRAEQRKKNPPKADTVDTNASWHVSPAAAIQAGEALRQYLEWETHKRALPNDALWYILYRAKLIDAKTPEPAKRDAALKYLGFIPVSPDDVPYRYDAARDEMVNQRHGSLRQPTLHPSIADTSPLVELLARFPSLRVDLRFREDGFHSTLTLQRKTMK